MGALCSSSGPLPSVWEPSNGTNGTSSVAHKTGQQHSSPDVQEHRVSDATDSAQPSVASLQRANAELREQLLAAESKAALGLEQAAAERSKLQHDLDLALAELQPFRSSNSTLARPLSDVSASRPHEEHSHVAAANDKVGRVLLAIRAANSDSKLPALWHSPDFRRWEGVRMEGGHVTGLSLSGLQLTTLPEDVGELTSLTTLILSSNSLTRLPRSIGKLGQLTCLLLDNNALTRLPDELTDLVLLQSLWLQDNQLTVLPDHMGRLVNVRQLLCAANQLTAVPESLTNMCSLSSLWLDSNKLAALPSGLAAIKSLQRLRVDTSLLDVLSPELVRLTTLDTPRAGAPSQNGGSGL